MKIIWFLCCVFLMLFVVWSVKNLFNMKEWIKFILVLFLILVSYAISLFLCKFIFLDYLNLTIKDLQKFNQDVLLVIFMSLLVIWGMKMLLVGLNGIFTKILDFKIKYGNNALENPTIFFIYHNKDKALFVMKILLSFVGTSMFYHLSFSAILV